MLLNENPDILSYDSTGYSMYPALKPGDQLIVKPVQDYCKGDIVVFTHGGRSVTHRFIERNGDILTFLGDRLIYSEKVHVSQVTGKVML
ncbi:MAG: S24 family peptidase, partial [Fibrobacteres bacterium]|nr:S24 family peptidase [Fibrobacterota bacterium]